MKMIRLYAIEPTALRQWQDFRYVMEKLSFSEGRLMVTLPKQWVRRLLDNLDVSEIERQRFVTKLAQYKSDRMFPAHFPYDASVRWIDNAINLERAGGVDAILVAKETCDRDESLAYQTPAEIDDGFFSNGREVRIQSTAKELSAPARILMQWVPEATFVDPYFKITSTGNLSVLCECAKHVGARGRCRSFMIFTKSEFAPKGGEAYMRKIFDNKLGPLLLSPFTVSVCFIDSDATKVDFHARYLLTEKGGLRYDRGFSEQIPPQLTDISLLDYRLCQELLQCFAPNNQDLGICESWTWTAPEAV